ncbi:MAG: helix-turn-helix domain-containing protein [Flavobacteriales bacterium]
MARPSKLTQDQCERIRMLRKEGEPAPKLAKRFKISESSLYKILNGSYTAAPAGPDGLPPAVGTEDMGSTPSIFAKAGKNNTSQDSELSSRVRKAAAAGGAIDEITLAAAELIVAQAHYQRALNR